MVGNWIAASAAAVLMLGGLAVLHECHRLEVTWRSATGGALLISGAAVMAQAASGQQVPWLAVLVALCAAVPTARLLVTRTPRPRYGHRRVTDLGMLDAAAPQRERGGMRTWLMWAGGAASAVLMLLMMLTPRHAQAQAIEAPPTVSYWDPAARGKLWRVSGLGSGCAVWWYRPDTYAGWKMGRGAVDLQHWTLEQASKLGAALEGRDTAALVAMRDRPVAELADALRPCLSAAVIPPGPWVVRASGAAADGTRPLYAVTVDLAGVTHLGATLPGRALSGEPCDCARLRVVTATSTYCPPRYAPPWPMAALCEALP